MHRFVSIRLQVAQRGECGLGNSTFFLNAASNLGIKPSIPKNPAHDKARRAQLALPECEWNIKTVSCGDGPWTNAKKISADGVFLQADRLQVERNLFG